MARARIPLIAGGVAALIAAGCSAQTSRPRNDDEVFGARVRAYIMAHPELIEEAVQALDAKRTAAAAAAVPAAIHSHAAELAHDERDPVVGAPTGEVTVIEFFDYRCPYCKVADPALPAFLASYPNVRLVLKEFPILSDESEKAAHWALAAKAQGKYWPVHQALMALPTLNEATIETTLRDNGVDVDRARTDANAPTVAAEIEADKTLARALAINGTPSFVVGDTILAGWLPKDLDAAIKTAAKGGKTG